MLPFTLRQLDYLLAVSRHGGIAQAARALNIAQPSVAQAIAKLEAQTGLRLFERHHAKGVSLTPAGHAFLAEADAVTSRAQQAARAAAALSREATGHVRLGCFLSLAAFYLPGLVQAQRDMHPQFTVEARELALEAIADGLAGGSLDMALTYDIGKRLEAFPQTKLLAISPAVLLPARHALARRQTLTLADLAHEPYVMFTAPGSTEYFTALLHDAGLSPPIAYAASSIEGVRSAVANGFGFSIVALRPPTSKSYDGKALKTVPLKGKLPPLNIVLASRQGFAATGAARRFTETCRGYFEALQR